MTAVTILVCLIGPLVILDIAALLWGADSREGLRSQEWEHRRGWFKH